MTEGWSILMVLGKEEDASLVAGFLDSHGVPVQVESLLFHQEPVTFGQMGEVRVLVPESYRETAQRLLAERPGVEAAEEAPS
jgi:hypothetical protein